MARRYHAPRELLAFRQADAELRPEALCQDAPISATVNMMDSGALSRMDLGFYVGVIVGPLLKFSYEIHVLGLPRY